MGEVIWDIDGIIVSDLKTLWVMKGKFAIHNGERKVGDNITSRGGCEIITTTRKKSVNMRVLVA